MANSAAVQQFFWLSVSQVGPDKGSVMMGHSPMTPESAKPAAVTNTSPEIEDVNAEDDDQPHGNDGVPENGHIVVAAALNFNSEQCKRAPPSSTEEGLSFNNEESKLPSPPSPSEGPSAIRSSPSNVVRELHQATTPPANRHVSNNHRFSGPPPTNNNQQHWPGNHTPAPR